MFHVEHLLMLSPLRPTAQRGLSPLRPTAQRGGVEFAAQPGRRSAHAVHGDRNRASAFKHQGACCGCYRGLTLTLPIRGAQSQYWRPTAGRVGGDAGGGSGAAAARARGAPHDLRPQCREDLDHFILAPCRT